MSAVPSLAEWVEAELKKAPPLTQEQQQNLRRVLLPTRPIARPA
jgi:hypothetical protein